MKYENSVEVRANIREGKRSHTRIVMRKEHDVRSVLELCKTAAAKEGDQEFVRVI